MDRPDHWTPETIEGDGVTLQTYRTGSGPPLVLLHGCYDSGRRWVRLADDLRDDYTVVTYDARGHGQSDAPDSGYSIDDRVGDLQSVIDGLGLDDPILVGHSMGAGTVGWYAVRHSGRLRGAVLADPDGFHELPDISPDEMEAAVRENFEGSADWTLERLIEEHYEHLDREQAARLARASLEVSEEAVVRIGREGYPEPLVDQFPDVECPTLILRSDRDVDTRIRDLDAPATLPDGRLVHIPDAGHYVFQDEYDAAMKELRTFLSRH